MSENEGKWQEEVKANNLVQNQNRPCQILPLLHSHIYGNYYNLVFPLADCNLKEFYKDQEPTIRGERFRLIEQLSLLVPALGTIHMCDMSSEKTTKQIGYHRDLKPDNVLVFKQRPRSRFMISDLGLARFTEFTHQEDSGVEWSYGRSAYKAPECFSGGKKVGRGGDIWSMGCILAEAITWVVCGHKGVEDFGVARKTMQDIAPFTKIEMDWFFEETNRGPDGTEVPARLKIEVLRWFDSIRRITDHDPFICDALKLVESMLKESAKGRPTAEKIDCEFYSILDREANRLSMQLEIEKPTYYERYTGNKLRRENHRRQRLSIPYSYTTGLPRSVSLKRQRSAYLEDLIVSSPTLENDIEADESQRPSKKRDVTPYVHLKRLDTVSIRISGNSTTADVFRYF
jgi:serine/threonine protein kinase